MTFPDLTVWQTAAAKISPEAYKLDRPAISPVLDFSYNRSLRPALESAGELGWTTLDRARDGVQESHDSKPTDRFVTNMSMEWDLV